MNRRKILYKTAMSQPARPYIRMNGAGNAFIVVQAFEEPFHPTEEQVRYWLAGNLCRCTGYDKIIRAVMDAAAEMRGAN